MGAPAAAGWDATDLLDVHVDQLARPLPFVADRGGLRRPDHLPGEWVALDQSRDLVASQDPGHGPRSDTELGTQPIRSSTVLETSSHHRGFDCWISPSRCPVRARGAVEETRFALIVEAGNPTVRALPRDAHRLRDMRHGRPLDADPVHQQAPAMHGESSVTVRHEDLRSGVKTAISTLLRRSSRVTYQTSPT